MQSVATEHAAGPCLGRILRAVCTVRRADTPVTLDYKVMEGSLYNTPPCWSIYVCGLVFKHLLAAGGLPGVKANNDAKAKLVLRLSSPDQPLGHARPPGKHALFPSSHCWFCT